MNRTTSGETLAAIVEFSLPQLDIVAYCAEEVGRQYRATRNPVEAARATAAYVRAWNHALRYYAAGGQLRWTMVRDWGKIVEPVRNAKGLRTTQAWVVGTDHELHEHMNAGLVPEALRTLVIDSHGLQAEEVYRQFEEIHPLADGNGRVGKIIYNWCLGMLHQPQMPPDFWGTENP